MLSIKFQIHIIVNLQSGAQHVSTTTHRYPKVERQYANAIQKGNKATYLPSHYHESQILTVSGFLLHGFSLSGLSTLVDVNIADDVTENVAQGDDSQ